MPTDSTVRTYDPKQVYVYFNGVLLTGFADEDITIKRNGKIFERKIGICGDAERTNKNNNCFDVKIPLKQTSPNNAILSAAAIADQLTNSGVGMLTITDLSGNSVFESAQTWISDDPEVAYGGSTKARVWLFETGPGTNLVAGNS